MIIIVTTFQGKSCHAAHACPHVQTGMDEARSKSNLLTHDQIPTTTLIHATTSLIIMHKIPARCSAFLPPLPVSQFYLSPVLDKLQNLLLPLSMSLNYCI